MDDEARYCMNGYQYYEDNPSMHIRADYCIGCRFAEHCSVRKAVIKHKTDKRLTAGKVMLFNRKAK